MAGYFVGSGQVLWVKVMELIHPDVWGRLGACKGRRPPRAYAESDMNSKFVGNIEVGGLLLCKAPEEKMKPERIFQKMANNQMESVDNNYLRENDPRMPMLTPERNTRTTFGKTNPG